MEDEPVSKIVFDKMPDFKFTAAYQAYSKSFDRVPGDQEKRRLNDLIVKLSSNEISYPQFYDEINQYLGISDRERESSPRIQGQRKRDYRHDQQKRESIRRHKR